MSRDIKIWIDRLRGLRRDWTRVTVYLLVIGFGLHSALYPLVSVERASPPWAATLLGAEFAIAGVLLLIGMGERKMFRFWGLLVVSLGLFTIAGLVAFVGTGSAFSFTMLFSAFAFDCIHDMRREKLIQRKNAETELVVLLQEIQTAINPERSDT